MGRDPSFHWLSPHDQSPRPSVAAIDGFPGPITAFIDIPRTTDGPPHEVAYSHHALLLLLFIIVKPHLCEYNYNISYIVQ